MKFFEFFLNYTGNWSELELEPEPRPEFLQAGAGTAHFFCIIKTHRIKKI
jgi:hypothetical protein